ncbi:MAG: ATP synthase F1 subunit epsilon [Oscillospiraceae bacterium]
MANFHLQIVTPDGAFYDGDGERLIVRAIDGDVCILANHIEYLTALGSGEAQVMTDGKVRKAACHGGMLSVKDNMVRLVATSFEWAENIDKDRAEKARELAQKRIDEAKDAAELELAKAKLLRALTRLKVVE